MANEKITLSANKREISGKKVKTLRKEDIVPGVIYGSKIEPINIQIELLPLLKAIKTAGTHSTINLDVNGEKYIVLIKKVTRETVKTTPIHIDFQAVSADETVRTEVPIRVIDEDESQAKKLGFLFMQSLEEIEIKAKPANLPEFLAVSAKSLEKHDDKLLVSDIIVPEGVELWVDDLDAPILTVADPSVLAARNEAEEQKEAEESAATVDDEVVSTEIPEAEKAE